MVLEVGPEARNTSSRVITIFTGRAGLARERERHRLEEHRGLAAEAAADLRGGDAQLGDVHAEQRGADVAHHEMALGAAPELALAVGADAGEAGMRLDIALMGRLGLEAALDDDVGLGEALLDIAMAELVTRFDDVGGLLRRRARRRR